MLAVDTNVLVRLLATDDQTQAARAARLFSSSKIWIAKTVLLETEWVMRSLFGFSRERIVEALQALAGLPNVNIEDQIAVRRAFQWTMEGLDFADALNLASIGESEKFATFDEKLVKRARRLGITNVRTC